MLSSKLLHGLLHGMGRDSSWYYSPRAGVKLVGWRMVEVVGAGGIWCNNCFV